MSSHLKDMPESQRKKEEASPWRKASLATEDLNNNYNKNKHIKLTSQPPHVQDPLPRQGIQGNGG